MLKILKLKVERAPLLRRLGRLLLRRQRGAACGSGAARKQQRAAGRQRSSTQAATRGRAQAAARDSGAQQQGSAEPGGVRQCATAHGSEAPRGGACGHTGCGRRRQRARVDGGGWEREG